MPFVDASEAGPPPAIVVVGTREAAHHSANSKESADADQLRTTTNVRNTEDALRYFPSLFVRKRHIGDTQAPLATRTSGVGASARSLVYADGVLLSALIGNNNNFASPRWGMVSPEEIDRVDVLYGPSPRPIPAMRSARWSTSRRGCRKSSRRRNQRGNLQTLRPICDPRRLSRPTSSPAHRRPRLGRWPGSFPRTTSTAKASRSPMSPLRARFTANAR